MYELIGEMHEEYNELKQQRDLYKSVIDEVREFADNFIETRYYSSLDEYITQFTWNKEKIDLLEILDKAKVGDE